ncbi:class I SAM-dependent methyltransferase [Sinosporangium siamense]|uniref:SAM-dependent methyltransferase n=1 Tax=Sinosporangium siamense TaxID=1367973 RepID=A0A919RQ23_9ACTN|nr:class I SAM-dependent methyltransferase [Sinosporangium siamense]GII96114.1 SAM-dependent methyltransferase [Sinosporangium siamense]
MSKHHHHHDTEPDWEALGAHLEREAGLHASYHDQAARWLHDLTDGKATRILDVGSGPGVFACRLAGHFPHADVVAVDQGHGLLDRARRRAAEHGLADRLTTLQADLPEQFDTLGTADLIWTSNVVHHLGDQQAALNGLAARLRPGGVLAVAERGLPFRFLPRDIGQGRPGLQARIDAALEDWFTAMRDQTPDTAQAHEDWPAMLTEAGLTPTGTRTFLTDLPAPLPPAAREHLHAHVTRLHEVLADRLDPADHAVLGDLLDGDSRTSILTRPDAFYLSANTVHTARTPS